MAYWNHRELDFRRPVKPTHNTLIEIFNSHFCQEYLNEHWFLSLDDARTKIETWCDEYNYHRPHSSLGYRSPKEFMDDSKMENVAVG